MGPACNGTAMVRNSSRYRLLPFHTGILNLDTQDSRFPGVEQFSAKGRFPLCQGSVQDRCHCIMSTPYILLEHGFSE